MQNNILLASVFHYAGQFQHKQGNFSAASTLYRRALRALKNSGCENSAHAGLILMDLSECLDRCGQAESSQQLFSHAVAIMKTNASRFLEKSLIANVDLRSASMQCQNAD